MRFSGSLVEIELRTFMGYFWGWGRVQKLFWGLLIQTNNFCFLSLAQFLLYHVVLSSCGWWWWWQQVVGGGGSQQIHSLNPTTVLVVLLLGCDNYGYQVMYPAWNIYQQPWINILHYPISTRIRSLVFLSGKYCIGAQFTCYRT